MPYEVDGERNLIAKTVMARGADPHSILIDRQPRPKILKAHGPQFDEWSGTMGVGATASPLHRFGVESDEVAISG